MASIIKGKEKIVEIADIRNNLNFIIKENGNGSYDLVVKNVEFAEVN